MPNCKYNRYLVAFFLMNIFPEYYYSITLSIVKLVIEEIDCYLCNNKNLHGQYEIN